MGKNIFISYKYMDQSVRSLNKSILSEVLQPTIARHYVDILQEKLRNMGNINLGEKDGEDLSQFKDETVESKLRDKIFNSSLTIVLISKNMKDMTLPEDEQWIPWEVSYSLKETTREDRTSRTNALLGVVLPDKTAIPYEYFIKENHCYADCSCRTYNTPYLFKILRENMFNKKNKTIYRSNCPIENKITYSGYYSYIYSVKWDDFLKDINKYIDIAYKINSNISDYEIRKQVD